MSNLVEASGSKAVIGISWGDEGKGDKVDYFAQNADIVARFQGGDNAGHTVTWREILLKLHLIPSGILNPNAISVIGSEVIVNPLTLVEEIHMVRQKGIDVDRSRFLIDRHAQLIMPWHKLRDNLQEAMRGGGKIGTTGRGIGPAYADKAAQVGLKVNNLLARNFEELFTAELADQERILQAMAENPKVIAAMEQMAGDPSKKEMLELFRQAAKRNPFDKKKLLEQLDEARHIINPLIANVVPMVHNAVCNGKNVLFEGAQGVLLDIEQGTYPYRTASHPGAAGIATAFGIYPHQLVAVIGVMKAFQTRVGEGPFPTELFDAEAARLRGTGANPWDEYGTTTGRPRRVGWLDLALERFGAQYGGATCFAITKMDILAGYDRVPVCIGYRVGNKFYAVPPTMDAEFLNRAKPVFKFFAGWEMPKGGVHSPEDIPQNARDYMKGIEDLMGLPIKLASFGPDREDNILF